MIKRIGFIALFLIAFNFLEHFAHKKTDGFSLRRIQFEGQISEGERYNYPQLSQPFRYLNCGNQCFAFISEDGNYVLKFFKYANSPIPRFMTQIPVLNHFKPFRPHRYEKMLWKQQRDFKGYELAYNTFREETGLIAIHLTPSDHGFPTITLSDKLNCRLTLDLNRTPFILQHRAIPVYKQLRAWIAAGRSDLAKQGIASLQELLKKRIALNLRDDDVHFYSNFGFVGTSAIQVDPGHYTQGTTQDPALEMKTITDELITWCKKNAPELL
jgi:hypothetical protein